MGACLRQESDATETQPATIFPVSAIRNPVSIVSPAGTEAPPALLATLRHQEFALDSNQDFFVRKTIIFYRPTTFLWPNRRRAQTAALRRQRSCASPRVACNDRRQLGFFTRAVTHPEVKKAPTLPLLKGQTYAH